VQRTATAGADRAVDIDDRLDPRQVDRQGAAVRLSPGSASFTPVRLVMFGLRLAGGLDLLSLLQPELQLLLGQALGPASDSDAAAIP